MRRIKGCRNTLLHNKRISLAHKGRVITWSDKISKACRHPKTEEHRKNISKGKKGVKFSEEHKKNLSISHLEYYRRRREQYG